MFVSTGGVDLLRNGRAMQFTAVTGGGGFNSPAR